MCGGFRLSVGLFMQQFRQKRTSLELPVDFSSVWEGREGEKGDAVCMASSALQSLWQGLAKQSEPGL